MRPISSPIALALTALLVACSGSSTATPEPTPPPSITQRVGPSGGTVELAGGASVVIPDGALAATTDIAITERRLPPPPGVLAVGPGYQLDPDIGFATTVTITLPWDPTGVPTDDPDAKIIVFRDVGQGPVPFPAEVADSTHVAVATQHFSTYQPYRFSVRYCLPFEHVSSPGYPSAVNHSELTVPGSDPAGVSRKLVCEGQASGSPSVSCTCRESTAPNLTTYAWKGREYRTYVHYTPHLSWIYLFHCGWQCSPTGVKFPLPAVLRECEYNDDGAPGTCGTWTWNGWGGYDAVWANGATATITVTSWGEGGVAFTRQDKTVAFSGAYEGALGTNRATGRVNWGIYGTGTWTITW